MPVDEAGRFYDDFGWLHGMSTTEAAEQIIGNARGEGASSSRPGCTTHRYPECWRCHTPLIFRIADDWFISVRDLRQPMLDANADVEWTPEYMGKRMDDWLRNMGDWNISRRRYYGLPLPFYPCACGHLNVIGSQRGARGARGRRGSTSSRSCAGRGSTACRSAARSATSRSSASRRSATSGSTRASSRSRRSAGENPTWIAGGLRDRRGDRA